MVTAVIQLRQITHVILLVRFFVREKYLKLSRKIRIDRKNFSIMPSFFRKRTIKHPPVL